jgi:acetoin utilization protein AcuC
MAIAIFYTEELREYDFGPGHPFRGDRYEIFPRFLRENLSEDDNYRILKSEPATEEDLLRICRRDYIDFTQHFYKAASLGLTYSGRFSRFHSADNTPIGKPGKLEEAARLIIGQAKSAADVIQGDEFKKAVSIGGGMHHAKEDYGEGFCIYNDVAFSAIYLMENYGLERILILDTDAHAGNGTSDYFYSNPRVLFIDLHQDPRTLYPGTGFAHQIGEGEGKGYTINVPLPMLAGYDSYKLVFDEIVQPVAEEFKPQIIIRNGGADPYFGDGLTNLGLPISGFSMIGERVAQMSARLCQGRIIDLIGSGYNERALPYAWLSLICGLAGIEISLEDPEPIPQRFSKDLSFEDTKRVVGEIKGNLKDFWSCFK